MIYTSNYNSIKTENKKTYSISGNRGITAGYYGNCYPELAPKKAFWQIFHDNIGKISQEENIKYYIEEYWKQVLSKLDPQEVYKKLDDSILLCYEEPNEFCHRHIVAAWFKLLLNKHIPEVIQKNNELEEIKRPDYIKYLEETIRKNTNMQGFNSIMAFYFYKKGEEYEKKIEQFHCKDVCCPAYMSEAISLKCYADKIENDYNNQKKIIK